MDIRELKNRIENRDLDDSMLILKYADNTFLADQYIEEIARYKGLDIIYITNLNDIFIESQSLFDDEDSKTLYILNVEILRDFKDISNCIIKCKSIEVTDSIIEQYVIDIPKLENWQIIDYMKSILPGLKAEEVEWLCDICHYDINRLYNEATKINIFQPNAQRDLFHELSADGGYSDLSSLNIFDFTSAILKKDHKTIIRTLQELANIDIEPLGVVTILRKNILNIMKIQLNPRATPDSTGMSQKQFNAVKYNCGKFSNIHLMKIFEMLTSIDSKLKTGELPNELIIDYVLLNILG